MADPRILFESRFAENSKSTLMIVLDIPNTVLSEYWYMGVTAPF